MATNGAGMAEGEYRDVASGEIEPPVDPVAPSDELARELEQVAASAAALRDILARVNLLPDDFPKDHLDALAATLERAPGMSADGALHALTYARPKLSQTRRRWVEIPRDEVEYPDVPRGGAIDTAIRGLIADVDTAREWYDAPRQDIAEASAVPEGAVAAGGTPDVADLAERTRKIADDSGAIADELEAGATDESVRADNLVRRVRDVEILSRQEEIELSAAQPRLRLIDQLNRGVKRAFPYAIFALRAIRVGADFSKVFFERFGNIMTRMTTVWCEEISKGTVELENLIERYRKEWSEKPKATGAGSDFSIFRDVDGPWCPEMVVIPAGSFMMGTPDDEEGRDEDEGPRHEVTIGYRFALGRYAVTFEEYDQFCTASGWNTPDDANWGRRRRPVINVSWHDAQAYVAWLSRETGQRYRLPSEAEWEYACRAGTTTPFSLGETISTIKANFDGNVKYGKRGKSTYRKRTVPVGKFRGNPWGLHEMHGNVYEWVEDHWHDSYQGAPNDGSAWINIERIFSDYRRVMRGGSWGDVARIVRSASRSKFDPVSRSNVIGFRVARTLY
ncbi:MAG: SUMF1/EgtB/PvdO family nonheme iron enzyme [Rhodospirillales bacterium]|nr:SUMF1/EgtB/PvdO family nonheme iron enzyme [Rhodospirillales bacterium]